ncbi:co-chaperone DjlA [Neptunicella marina]|uniref:Co-chaperone protein DjlA n=1 Tax=Neptunicella marina TaxID=2125989 RepID=A0A8J6M1F4_9ALTE|nr:co-chaperone DjlA [Neptunicella marina]MBC3765397.1 co-chaperone DjlA [Neptunicella marina]
MRIWGRILGTLFGFMFARIPGAIIGFVVGHLFDKGYSQDFDQMGGFGRFFGQANDMRKQAIFFHALFSLMGHVAKANGRVTKDEINMASQLMDQMNLEGEVRREAQQAFNEGKAADFPVSDILQEFKQSCHGRRDIMQVFLEILIQAAFADGQVQKEEQVVLEKAARALGFRNNELLYLISIYEAELRFRQGRSSGHGRQKASSYSTKDSLSDAYKILGVSASDSMGDIKKAYRKLMSENHPDKLVSKGLPKQALEIAKNKAQDIQAAYELIKSKRG